MTGDTQASRFVRLRVGRTKASPDQIYRRKGLQCDPGNPRRPSLPTGSGEERRRLQLHVFNRARHARSHALRRQLNLPRSFHTTSARSCHSTHASRTTASPGYILRCKAFPRGNILLVSTMNHSGPARQFTPTQRSGRAEWPHSVATSQSIFFEVFASDCREERHRFIGLPLPQVDGLTNSAARSRNIPL